MKSSLLYTKLKRKINQDHTIFMFGIGEKLLKSAYTFVRESREEDPENAGCFHHCHPKTGLPAIYIYHNDPMHKDHFDKVITLAHEYGHFISFQNEYEVANFASDNWHHFANGKKLDEEQKQSVIDEEVRAWSNARVILKDYISHDDSRWKRFNNTRRNMLRSYHTSLKK